MRAYVNADIDTRTGWPDGLCILLKAHPRAAWKAHGSAMVDFWLAQHDSFRRQCEALRAAADDFRAARTSPSKLCAVVTPQLHGFLEHLHGHHQVEDHHYFPAFRSAERRLASGFDVLARDHVLIHLSLEEIVGAINAFVTAVHNDAPQNETARQRASERYVDVSERLHKRLLRHLDDEEDLVIPFMLAHGH
jgi:iron-sulfur cluster repair protein YtfE (RIC family)